MQATISGTKQELQNALSSLDFKVGKIEISTPEVLAAKPNGNGHRVLSMAARRAISRAQKARWAEARKKKSA